jgi:flagellar protein FliO/FliZ
MSTDTDMWLAFARTFGMLFVVLAVFLVAFYLFRRFSAGAGTKGANLIQVMAVHHVSPKEKLMLVNVLNENILIGVTPQSISSLAVLGEKGIDVPARENEGQPGFSDLLKRTLKQSSVSKGAGAPQSSPGTGKD